MGTVSSGGLSWSTRIGYGSPGGWLGVASHYPGMHMDRTGPLGPVNPSVIEVFPPHAPCMDIHWERDMGQSKPRRFSWPMELADPL